MKLLKGIENINILDFKNEHKKLFGISEEELKFYFSGYVDRQASLVNPDDVEGEKEKIYKEVEEECGEYQFDEGSGKRYNLMEVLVFFEQYLVDPNFRSC